MSADPFVSSAVESEARATQSQASADARLTALEAEVATLRGTLYAILECVGWAIAAVMLGIPLLVVQRPEGFLWPRVFDASHALLSGGVALVALRLSRRLIRPVLGGALIHYGIALGVATAIGAGLEIAQIIAAGGFSWRDLLRDVAGASAALAVVLSLDASLESRLGCWARNGLRSLAVAVLLGVVYPVGRAAWLIRERESVFPILADFESEAEEQFTRSDFGAKLSKVPPPSAFTLARGANVGQVMFPGGGRNPKFELAPLYGDWSRARDFAFEVYSDAHSPVSLLVRIDDQGTDGQRFNGTLTIPPGQSTQRISVERIRHGLDGRELDLTRMKAVLLYRWQSAETIILHFDAIRLEF